MAVAAERTQKTVQDAHCGSVENAARLKNLEDAGRVAGEGHTVLRFFSPQSQGRLAWPGPDSLPSHC